MKTVTMFETDYGSVESAAVLSMLSEDDRRAIESVSVRAADGTLDREYVSPKWQRVKAAMHRAMAVAEDLTRDDPPGVRT